MKHLDTHNWKMLANIVRVAASDDNKRFSAIWKELSRGD